MVILKKAVYRSLLITNTSNDKINSIEDIKGHTMAFVDSESTSGNLVPTSEIMKAFPNDALDMDKLHTNDVFFTAVSYSGSHQAGIQAVARGDVEIVPVSNQILASEIASGNVNEADIKVIQSFSQSFEDIPRETLEALEATGTNKLSVFINAVLLASFSQIVAWVGMRLGTNFSECAVLGMVGAGGVGFVISRNLQNYEYGTAGLAIVRVFVIAYMIERMFVFIKKKIA